MAPPVVVLADPARLDQIIRNLLSNALNHTSHGPVLVRLSGDDAGRWMVRHGHAWSQRFRRSAGPYAAEEALAHGGRLGLWARPAPLEPRLFRKGHGACPHGG